MRHLSDDQRQVLLLRYVAGFTAAEVASTMDKTDGAIRSLQHRGERSLARLLTPRAASSRPVRASQERNVPR
jgi:DNA-directed RNA polymerase specialized sigma24 family protein